jgi:hypothetical protein
MQTAVGCGYTSARTAALNEVLRVTLMVDAAKWAGLRI